MKMVRWTRFTWELSKLPPIESSLPERYVVRTAEPGEEKAIGNVVFSAFAQESTWSDPKGGFRLSLQLQLDSLLGSEEVPAVVVCHGQRIIGASLLAPAAPSENHLVSGPCVLMEYRNRGLGTALLYHSLQHLKQAGLERAHGLTRENVVPSKFIYPKFESTSCEYEFEASAPAGA